MTCVGLDIGMRLRFGAWHGRGKGLPDLTIWDRNHNALVAGEVKTPWTLDLGEMMATEDGNNPQFRRDFPTSAGQVANYMKQHSYKYGFLTTYTDTVFFKQESYTFTEEMASLNNFRKGETITVLYYSNAISHETASTPCGDQSNPFHYTNRVSVRECFLFLMTKLASHSHEFSNHENPWTKENKGKQTSGRLAKFLKFAAPLSIYKGAPSSLAPQGYPSSSQQQQYRSRDGRDYYSTTDPKHSYYTHSADPLADKMSGLHLKERSSESASGQGRGRVTVHWDARREKYSYTASSGKQKHVDSSTTVNGELWVKIHGEKFRATAVS
ncbi:MAG: hypothetical protein Q9207_005597 [Kuettlingeria erythrocarpa]